MYKVVLLRHGQSQWYLENRFTGWHDVDLTEQGQAEARAAGQVLKENGFVFDKAYSSLLKRAIRTLWLALEELDQVWLPVRRDWRLNERHYGALQGLNKARPPRNTAKIRSSSGGVPTMCRRLPWEKMMKAMLAKTSGMPMCPRRTFL